MFVWLRDLKSFSGACTGPETERGEVLPRHLSFETVASEQGKKAEATPEKKAEATPKKKTQANPKKKTEVIGHPPTVAIAAIYSIRNHKGRAKLSK